MKNLFRILFLIVTLGTLTYFISQQTIFRQSIFFETPGRVFANKFESDVEYLRESGNLPKMWDDLKEVKFITTSKGAEIWLEQAKPNISTKADGKYLLEYVLIDDTETDKQSNVALVQMSLIELASGNKTWELARVYTLDDDDEN